MNTTKLNDYVTDIALAAENATAKHDLLGVASPASLSFRAGSGWEISLFACLRRKPGKSFRVSGAGVSPEHALADLIANLDSACAKAIR